MIFSILCGLVIYKFQQPAWSEFIFQDGNIIKQNIFVEASKYYILSWLPTIVYAAFAFMISVLTRSSGGAIGISLFLALSGNIALLAATRYDWAKYLLPANTDLYSIAKNGSFIDGVTFPFASCMLLLYLFVFLIISYTVFLKRDLAKGAVKHFLTAPFRKCLSALSANKAKYSALIGNARSSTVKLG